MTSLNGTQIERVPSYKYHGSWLGDKPLFKKLVKKLKLKFQVFFLFTETKYG